MRIKTLVLKDFRSYEHRRIDFTASMTHLYGPNARGKTNLIEAIFYLMTGRSFRTSRLTELVRQGSDTFSLSLIFESFGVEQTLSVLSKGRRRRIQHNHALVAHEGGLLGLLRGVVYGPEDKILIKGEPEKRRRYLDIQLSQIDPLYIHHLKRYTRALKQRNVLLKQGDLGGIEIWEHELAKSGVYITLKRSAAVEALHESVGTVYRTISDNRDDIELSYKTQLPLNSSPDEMVGKVEKEYEQKRETELRMRYTLLGPHRDDCLITLNGLPAHSYASEGQQRSCALAMRIAEWEHLKKRSDEIPIMLLDDVSMGFDTHRKENIYAHLSTKMGQVISTAPDENWIGRGGRKYPFETISVC